MRPEASHETIHWSPSNIQQVLALVDTGVDSTLSYGNLGQFEGPLAYKEVYGGHHIWARQATVILGIICLAPRGLRGLHLSPLLLNT